MADQPNDTEQALPSNVELARRLEEVCSERCDARQLDAWSQQLPWDVVHPLASEVELINSAQPAYVYQKIKPWQIRLLLVHPGQRGSSLVADLRVAYLVDSFTDGEDGAVIKETDEKVQYQALSYCWGSAETAETLQVEGKRFFITGNLFEALQHLRCRNAPAYFWIDALCIDQWDTAERSTQIQNMLLIYSKAAAVPVWLGEATRSSRFLFAYHDLNRKHLELSCIPYRNQKVDPSIPPTPDASLSAQGTSGHARHGSGVRFGGAYEASICRGHAEMLYKGLLDLLSRPWFKRVWIRQEVWSARKVSVMCGDDSLDWDVFCDLRMLAEKLDDALLADPETLHLPLVKHFDDVLSGLRIASRSDRLHAKLEDKQSLSSGYANKSSDIVTVLNAATHSESTDHRDRVYGLLGMTSVKTTSISPHMGFPDCLSLEVNYAKHPCEVFQDVMRYLIRREGTLAPLMLAASFGSEIEGRRLPSWVINWRRPLGVPELRVTFPATVRLEGFTFHADVTFPGPDVLRLKGNVFGTVVHTNNDASDYERDTRAFQESSDLLGRNRTMVKIQFRRACHGAFQFTQGPRCYYTGFRDSTQSFHAHGTASTYVFAAPEEVEEGDTLAFVNGSDAPLFLRRLGTNSDDHEYIGPGLPCSLEDNSQKYFHASSLADQLKRVWLFVTQCPAWSVLQTFDLV